MTTDQLTFDLAELVEPTYSPDLSLAERFAIFHEANPHVADALESLAAQWLAAGNRKVGAKALVERLRWESGLRTEGQAYRINNSHVSFYSRLLIERHPEWADCIDLRHAPAVEAA
ncbi:hypothetical protein EFK50_07660 [Nocardioides marmoriginsengisoli]|uniref:Uncharacterized protein n=1 Tax=Nocardioides marmoriginsengisoli TaxID=661483 RepID=A0A3N0CM62_9ACTN|nr:hypothetical protein [Nocardioides marmoriginsengisoli]RNL64391.1 hypothetical protein EFK50_07660 [Nocardioides marmoriginsengisoli]